MKCPNDRCGEKLEVHDTDQYSTYYCQDCGYEEKVVWPVPVKRKRPTFDEPLPSRRPKPKNRNAR